MNEEKEKQQLKFEGDIAKTQLDFCGIAPEKMFIGEMQCFLCQSETIGMPKLPSKWRAIQVEEKNIYYFCRKCCPSDLATEASWKNFYSRAIRKIYQKDFNRPLEGLTFFRDFEGEVAGTTRFVKKTPSGSMEIKKVENLQFNTIQELLKNVFEQVLPVIVAAVEHIAPSNGTQEFAATGDIDVVETFWNAALKVDFQSFGGVTLEMLPPDQREKAKQFLPLYQTIEQLIEDIISLSVEEMERQDKAGIQQGFQAAQENLTFIEGFLYKIVATYSFVPKGGKFYNAPPNPNLN